MNGAVALPALAQKLRNRLWRERAIRALGPGLAGTALLLLAAALCHLWLQALPAGIWLPMAALPPLLALAVVALWRRPDAAEAVAVYDQRLALNEFLVSAWEAWQLPAGTRTGGARALLAQFAARGAALPDTARWPAPPPGRGFRRARAGATWLTLMAALFMLQLPGRAPTGTGQLPPSFIAGASTETIGPGSAQLTDERGAGLFSEPPRQGDSGPAPADEGRVGDDTALTLATAEQTLPPVPERRAFDDADSLAGARNAERTRGVDNASPAPRQAGGRAEPAAQPRGTSAGSEDGADASTPAALLDPAMEKRYAAVARGIAKQLAGSIAGPDGQELAATIADASSSAGAAAAPRQLAGTASFAGTSLFSPTQRQQIAAYFEQLEGRP